MRLLVTFVVALSATLCLADETLQDSPASSNTSATAAAGLLNVVVINSTSVQLHWNSTKECRVRRYIIRVKDGMSTRARSWRYDDSTSSSVINGLHPATEYHFRLVVDNECSGGKNRGGKWVTIRTPRSSSTFGEERVTKRRRDKSSMADIGGESASNNQLVPGLPMSVRTRVVTPDSVLVTWLAPEDGGPVKGFMIGYGEGVPDVNWQYLEAHRRNVTIKNLKPSTQYVISVRAFNDADKGPVVYDLVYTTVSSFNSVTLSDQHTAPTKLHARMLSPTSVWIQWMDSSLGRSQRLADSRYYNVHYQATPNGKTLSVIVKDLHAVLNDLEPGTRYEFKVRTVKDGQTSPFSETIVTWTSNTTTSAGTRSAYRPYRPSDRDINWQLAAADEEKTGFGDEDTDDDNEWFGADKSLSRETQQFQGDSSKTKREPASAARREFKQHMQLVSGTRLQQEVTFSTIILHRISAYITWSAVPPSDQCNATKSRVVGYRLRYQPTTDHTEFVSQNLSENVVLLENLQSGKYRYQVKYLLENGVETAWSVEGIFDTMPSQH